MFKKSPRKLALHRETVGELSTPRLQRAAGGIPTLDTNCPTCNISCDATCMSCFCPSAECG
jgi:hypothetical protein